MCVCVYIYIYMYMYWLKPFVAQARETPGASLSHCIQFATPGLLVVLLVTHHLIQPLAHLVSRTPVHTHPLVI